MSARDVEEIIRRAGADTAYARLLETDEAAALHGYDISPAERQALIAGDVLKLEELGVSPELSLLAGELNRDGDRMR